MSENQRRRWARVVEDLKASDCDENASVLHLESLSRRLEAVRREQGLEPLFSSEDSILKEGLHERARALGMVRSSRRSS